MPITLPNLSLVVWNSPDDPYNSAQLAQNLQRIDEHDHSPGKGRPLSPDALSDGSVGTSKLVDLGVTTPKIANLNVTTGKLADSAVTFTKLDPVLRDLSSDALQEGVIGPGYGAVTRIDGVTVRVAAGTAWIDGDGVNGLTGRYRVTWPQTDLTVPAPGVAAQFIGYRVVVPLPAAGHGTSAPVLRAGTQLATVDHDLLQGVPGLANGDLQLAALISAFSTGVSATPGTSQGIRDRRTRARGVQHHYWQTTAVAAPTSTTYSGRTALATGAFDFRVESLGTGAPIEITFDAHVSGTGLLFLTLEAQNAGATNKIREFDAEAGDNSFHATYVPASPGSYLFQWKQFGAATVSLDVYASSPTSGGGRAMCTAKESPGAIGNNGTV